MKTGNTMTLEEFTRIVDLYGTKSEHWPDNLHADCQSLVARDPRASALLVQQSQIDGLLAQIEEPSFPGLQTRVLNQTLPERKSGLVEEIIGWLIPQSNSSSQVWRPAVAACIPLVFGIVLANYFSFGVGIEDDGFQYWGDELAMLSLTDYAETSF